MKRFGKRDCRFWHYKYNIHDNAQNCLCLVGKNIVYNSDSEVLLTAMKHNYVFYLTLRKRALRQVFLVEG